LQQAEVDIIIISISTPIKIGVYQNGVLFENIESKEMTSDFLPQFFDEILSKYKIKHIIYSNGPGSYMSIKLTYIFLKTLQIVHNFTVLAVDGFYFNRNSPIKAVGNRFFVKENDTITIKKSGLFEKFELPDRIVLSDFSDKIEPIYILNAV